MQNSATTKPVTLSQMLFVPKIVIAVLVSSTFLYAVVLTTAPAPQVNLANIFQPLIGFAITIGAMGLFVPKILLRVAMAKIPKDGSPQQKLAPWFVAIVIRGALFEAVAVIGFLAGYMIKTELYYPFWAASVLLQLLHFPTEQRFKSETGSRLKI